MQDTSDREGVPAGTAVSGRSTADLTGANGPSTARDALMRERDALVYYRQMLNRKRTEMELTLQKQRSDKEMGHILIVFPSAEALLVATRSDRARRTFGTHGTAHRCLYNSALLSSWPTPIDGGVGTAGTTEYQKSFHAHNLMRILPLAKDITLRSAHQVAAMGALTIVHPAPRLRSLELDVPELSEAIVQNISQWGTRGQLERIAVRLYRVTPTLEFLCTLPSLHSLDLSNTSITSEDLSTLQRSQSLAKLNLSYCHSVAGLHSLLHIRTLEVMKLSGCQGIVGVGALATLPRLKELHLVETAITDGVVCQLSENRSLVKIDLSRCAALINVNPFSSIATLEEIYLARCTRLTRAGALGKLPILKVLDMEQTAITDEEVCQLCENRTLVKIDLMTCTKLTNVNALSSIVTLEKIHLSHCNCLTRVGALGKLPILKELYLDGTAISDEEVRQLGENRSLVKIDLRRCTELTNVNCLSSIVTLEEIYLSYSNSLTRVGALGRLPILKELYLAGTAITDEEVCQLCENRTLVKIDLRTCTELTNVNPFSSIVTLEEITLSDCHSLTRVGALGRLPILKELYLAGTAITDEEVRQLCENRTLVKIDLMTCTELTNVNRLSSIVTLEEITLSDCHSLTRVGALGKLPILKELYLQGTAITDEEIQSLKYMREQLCLPSIFIG